MIETGRVAPARPRTLRAQYPLTGLQQGMLFHRLLEPGSGVDVQQIVCTLYEAVDVASLERAWNVVAARHDALSTSFRWEGLERPRQEVWNSLEIPLRYEDWRPFGRARQHAELGAFLLADRRAGFELAAAPLFRVTLFRTAAAQYELVWSVHHAIVDGRSFVHVLRDVSRTYEVLRRGAVPALEPQRPFADFVTWLESRDDAGAATFWGRRLRGLRAATPLPQSATAGRSAATNDRLPPYREATLARETTAALGAFAREHGVTLNTLVQGAWAIVLARHSGEADVVFGATRAGRAATIAGALDTVGPFINTLPVRTSVAPDRPLVPWLQELRADAIEMRAWEHTPLARVQAWSDVPPGAPLFESIVVFEHRSLESALQALGGAWSERRIRVFGQTNYPLSLEAYGDAELRLKLQFDARRYETADIDRVLSQLTTVLGALPGSTLERPIGAVPWLAAAERALVVEDFNRTAAAYPRAASMAEIFAQHVAATPGATAVEDGARRLSYRDLDARANELAWRLVRLGVGPDVPVGLCFERSAEAVIAALAILKAGGAYVPLDPAYPAERSKFMLEDTALTVVLTLERWSAAFPANVRTLCLDAAPSPSTIESTPAPPCAARPENLAYIMYTSGSTGRPKGVAVTQRGIIRLVVGATYAAFGAQEVWLSFAPLTFDLSTLEMWGALLSGARLAVFGGTAPTLEELGATIRAHGVTSLWLTAGLFQQIVESDLAQLRPLRQLLVGGDVLPVPHVRRALEALPDCRLINGYGPTENTTFTTTYAIPPDWNADGSQTSVPIGRPVENTTVYVLDETLAPVPVGVAGRLYTGGDGVARGYHGRPELTAERFIPDPFAASEGGRLYDTGDRARWLADGNLEFLGRADRQLKIRGFRIEPGEVEAALAAHSSVASALVVGRGDVAGGKRLVAYVVPRAGRSIDPAALATHLAADLPSYLVPSAIVGLAAFPLTPNGKIDHAALPDPGGVPGTERPGFVAPANDIERALADLWAGVLRVERVGTADNFFELGGDSILAIALVSRARGAGLRITPRQLYDRPTVGELAAVAQPAAAAVQRAEAGEPGAGLALGTAPLTPIQHWFFEAETRELDHWNQAFLFTVPAELETAPLRAAVGALIERHAALRLRFERVDGAWRQRFETSPGDVPCDVVDLSGVPPDGLQAAVTDACVRAQASLDIGAGPLARVLHLRLGAARVGRLFVAVHHLAVDGVSWRLLLEDLETAYFALRAARAPAFPAQTASLERWAGRLTDFARAGGFEAQRAYWHDVVAQPVRALPRDFAGVEADLEGDAETFGVALSAAETRALLQDVPAAYRTRINDVLLVALESALRSWAGNGSLLIDLEGHGREDLFDDVDLSRTVGWFTSVFPVRLDLSERGPRDALRAMKERLRALPHNGLGYGALRYLCADATLSAAPQSELVFNYLGQFDAAVADSRLFAFAPEASGAWRGPRARRRYAVEVNSLIVDGRLELRWSFNRKVHARNTLDGVAAEFVRALRALIEHCTAPEAGGFTPSDFPLASLSQAALDRLIATGRDVEDVYPLAPIQTLFQLFAVRASDPGFEQWRYRLTGAVDAVALRAAWEGVLARHAILRTTFVHEGLAEPLQVVRRDVELPWAEHDLRALESEGRARALAALLAADRAAGFDFEQAPLMRLALVRLGEAEYELVWSYHHLLLDRWSFPLVLGDTGALYRALRDGLSAPLPPAVPYRDYIRALQTQDEGAAENFWRTSLAGIEESPGFAPRAAARVSAAADVAVEPNAEMRRALSADESEALHAFARANRLSPSVVVLGAWALCLAAHTGASDFLIGLAVSGRPADLPGVERLVGVTINNVPLRARIAAQARALPWLHELAASQVDVQQFGLVPPASIQRWSGVPWRRRLFETLIVFQHASADALTGEWLGPDVRVEQAYTPTRTAFPLTLVVADGERPSLRLSYDARYFTAHAAGALLDRMHGLLTALLGSQDATLGELLATLPAAEAAGGDAAPAVVAREFVAPASAVEAVVARIWSESLGLPSVGASDNFFELGGQSLLAMQVVARVRETFAAEIAVRTLFEHPTVAAFATRLVAGEPVPGRLERIAALVQRVEAMSLEELTVVAHGD